MIYFIRFKKNGFLQQQIIKAPDQDKALEIAEIYFEVPKEKIKIYAARDSYGNLTRMED